MNRFIYTLNQGDASVTSLRFDPATGALTPASLTLVPGTAAAPGIDLSCIAVSPTGKTLYITNTSGNAISAYSVDAASGALTLMETVAAGTAPVQIVVDPGGRFAYAGNLVSNDISVYSIDAASGALESAGPRIASGGQPVSIVLIDH